MGQSGALQGPRVLVVEDRYMTLENMTTLSDDPLVSLPILAA
jgi:hypothetical protein